MTLFVIVHLSNCSNFRCSQEIANFYPKVCQNRSITIDYAMDMYQLQKNPTPSSSFQMQHSVTFSRNDNDNVTSYIWYGCIVKYLKMEYCEILENEIFENQIFWNIWVRNMKAATSGIWHLLCDILTLLDSAIRATPYSDTTASTIQHFPLYNIRILW